MGALSVEKEIRVPMESRPGCGFDDMTYKVVPGKALVRSFKGRQLGDDLWRAHFYVSEKEAAELEDGDLIQIPWGDVHNPALLLRDDPWDPGSGMMPTTYWVEGRSDPGERAEFAAGFYSLHARAIFRREIKTYVPLRCVRAQFDWQGEPVRKPKMAAEVAFA